jgi:hypothetical protein
MKKIVFGICFSIVVLVANVSAQVIEKNVITGKVTERPYTQKELDNIEASKPARAELDKRNLSRFRQKALLAEQEKMLMSGTTPEALAYRAAKALTTP